MKKRGMALITILMMLIILVMLVTAMVALNSNNLFYSAIYHNRVSALIAAESGVAYAIYALQEDPSWNPEFLEKEIKGGKFTIKFYREGYGRQDFYSINNLGLTTGNIQDGAFDGSDVLKDSVDLIVTGQSGDIIKRIRVVLTRSLVNDAGRFTGLLDIDAEEFRVTRVSTPEDPSIDGTIHTNSSGGDPATNPHAIFVNPACEVITNRGIISAVGNISSINSTDTTLKPKSLPKNIPEIDISKIITSKLNETPSSEKLSGGNYIVSKDGNNYKISLNGMDITIPGTRIENGTLIISKDLCFTGDVNFEFDLPKKELKDAGILLEKNGDIFPSLYIKSDGTRESSFNVYGKIEGNGSVYTSGDSKFIMETNLVASEDPGVALLCEGDVDINLPATHVEPAELDMTGLVYSHGNIQANILEDSSLDNPENACDWPEDWEDFYTGILDNSYYVKADGFKCGNWIFSGSSDSRILYNGDGTFTFDSGTGNIICNYETASTGVVATAGGISVLLASYTGGENTLIVGGSDTSTIVYSTSASTSYNLFNLNSPDQGLLGEGSLNIPLSPELESILSSLRLDREDDVVNRLLADLVAYDFEKNGTSLSPPPAEDEFYAPNVRVTGALVVADPDNMDGTGGYNSKKGNFIVDLSDNYLQNKGNLTLSYCNNYEKLLGNPLITNNLRATVWEEIK